MRKQTLIDLFAGIPQSSVDVRLTHWHQITRNPVLIKNQQLISIFLFVLISICTEIVITFPKRPELTKFYFPVTLYPTIWIVPTTLSLCDLQ